MKPASYITIKTCIIRVRQTKWCDFSVFYRNSVLSRLNIDSRESRKFFDCCGGLVFGGRLEISTALSLTGLNVATPMLGVYWWKTGFHTEYVYRNTVTPVFRKPVHSSSIWSRNSWSSNIIWCTSDVQTKPTWFVPTLFCGFLFILFCDWMHAIFIFIYGLFQH